jgi:polyphosphate kinase
MIDSGAMIPKHEDAPKRRDVEKPSFKSECFINRELSWLEFNARVLEEAQDPTTPLLERVKFLSIFSSNLDEFFMVRVAGLREEAFGEGAAQDINADDMKALVQLDAIAQRTKQLVAEQYRCLNDFVLPELQQEGVHLLPLDEVGDSKELDKYFRETVFPILTPMAIDPSHPRPRYHNRALYLAARLRRRTGRGPKQLFAVVHIPQVLPRLVPLSGSEKTRFVLLEDLVASRLPELFGGYDVKKSAAFRITRDSDLDLLEQESDDMLRTIESRLKLQHRADAVRLEIAADADASLIETIIRQERLRGVAELPDEDEQSDAGYDEVYRVPGPLDLTALLPLSRLSGMEHLRDRPFTAQTPRGLRRIGETLFEAIARRDVLLHHPYDSFSPVEEFVTSAAIDPQVLAIKQTLYRTSTNRNSPIMSALMRAAEEGKHVTAMVELKARFDEEANVGWARQLEQAGVHVVYGFMDLKTHCKMCLVVRREGEVVRRYVHLGTGNYNPTTARLYTDLGIFTADEQIADDVSVLFNLLTGYSQGHELKKLVAAPDDLHKRTVELIEEQTARAQDGKSSRIFAKLNSLVDRRVIEALYEASQAGVPIDLVVRGICCLRPGLKGISETIRVRSIVDRFLEHSRIFVFGEGDNTQVFFSSADWMPRNFYRRVEVMFPVESAVLKKRVLTELVPIFLKDNARARIMRPDGQYQRVRPAKDETLHRCQEDLLELHAAEAASKAAIPGDGVGDDAVTGSSHPPA